MLTIKNKTPLPVSFLFALVENTCIRSYSYFFLWLSHRIYRLLILNSTSWKMVGQTENYFHSFLPGFLIGKYFAKNVDVGFHFWAGNARASKLHIWKHEWKVRCYAVFRLYCFHHFTIKWKPFPQPKSNFHFSCNYFLSMGNKQTVCLFLLYMLCNNYH